MLSKKGLLAVLVILALFSIISFQAMAFSIVDWIKGDASGSKAASETEATTYEKEGVPTGKETETSKETASPETSSISKDTSESKYAGYDEKTISSSSGSAVSSSKEAASSARKTSTLEVVSEKQVRLVSDSALNTVCFNTDENIFTVSELDSEVEQTGYEFRTANVICDREGSSRGARNVVRVVQCGDNSMKVECTEGKVISYGGWCAGPGISKIGTSSVESSDTWSSLPTAERVELICDAAFSLQKSIQVTCMRERR